MIRVPQPEDDETYLSGFTIKDALRLNKMDKPNPVAVERAQPRPRAIVRAVLPIPAQPRPAPRPKPAQLRPAQPDLIGRYIQKKFQGYGKTIFKGKIMSYDAIRKFYTVQYEDKSVEEYTRAQINKFLIPLLNGAGLQYVIIGGYRHILQ